MLKLTAIKNKGELKKDNIYTLGGIVQGTKELALFEVNNYYDAENFGYTPDEVRIAMLEGIDLLPSSHLKEENDAVRSNQG